MRFAGFHVDSVWKGCPVPRPGGLFLEIGQQPWNGGIMRGVDEVCKELFV